MNFVIIQNKSSHENNLFVNIYRQHSVPRHIFYDELEQLLRLLPTGPNTPVVICGDVNINLAGNSKIPVNELDSYLNLLTNQGYSNLFTSYTRVSKTSSSCIDHCYIKNLDIDNVAFTHFDTQVKDHLGTAVSLSSSLDKVHANRSSDHVQRYKTYIDYKNAGILIDIFSDIFMMYDKDNPNYLSNEFVNSISTILKTSTTTKQITANKLKIQPWITTGILKSIRIRNRIGKKRFQSSHSMIRYQNYAATIKTLIAKAKADYFNNELIRYNGESKKTWKCVNGYLYGKHQNNSSDIESLVINGVETNIKQDIANNLNDYFSSIGETTVTANVQNPTVDNNNDIKIPSSLSINQLIIPAPNTDDIIKIIDNLKDSYHLGHDGLSNHFIKHFKFKLAPLITIICSSIIENGIFPDNLKISKIIPLHKKGSRSEKSNYRPISLSPILAKIVERYINSHLYKHLENIDAFPKSQFGFRQNRGCEDALHSVTNEICLKKNIKKNLVSTTFFDFSKAFDTVPHHRLLIKLKKFGVMNSHLKLLESYLTGRQVFTEIGGIRSEFKHVSRGVPQGGCLSSTLYNAYTADIQYLKLNGKLSLFADDSNIVNSAKSPASLKTIVEHDLMIFAKWCTSNELVLNYDKTTIMLLNKIQHNITFHIHTHSCINHFDCHCTQIQTVSSYKYLGIILDSSLSYQPHIDSLSIKLRRAIAALYKLACWNNVDISLRFYYACFQSHIDYCLSVWGNLSLARCNKLLILQKHEFRIIFQVNRLSPSLPLFTRANILPFRQRFIFRLCLCVYKLMTRKELITINNSVRHQLTGKLSLPSQHCRIFSRSLGVTSIRIYNWCGADLFTKRISKFKTDIKQKISDLYLTTNGIDCLLNGCWAV
jgi:hypothetical protein